MKRTVTRIRKWLREKAAERKKRERLARERAINDECEKELQVMEWHGGLNICHNGVPLIHQCFLQEDAVVVVKTSRETLKMWKEGTL